MAAAAATIAGWQPVTARGSRRPGVGRAGGRCGHPGRRGGPSPRSGHHLAGALARADRRSPGDLTRFHQPVPPGRRARRRWTTSRWSRRSGASCWPRRRRHGAGDRRWGQRQAIELEAAAPGRVDLYAEITFHPLNSFGAGAALPHPRSCCRRETSWSRATSSSMPRYGPRVDGGLVPYTPTPLPGGAVRGRSEPMLGATIVASFDGDALAAACSRRCDRGDRRGRKVASAGAAQRREFEVKCWAAKACAT